METDFERQIRMIKEIYDCPQFSPQMHWNLKYKTEEFKNNTPYISIKDLIDYKYVICAIPDEEVEFMMMEFNRRKVVAEYDSLEVMVADGWRLGT